MRAEGDSVWEFRPEKFGSISPSSIHSPFELCPVTGGWSGEMMTKAAAVTNPLAHPMHVRALSFAGKKKSKLCFCVKIFLIIGC